MGGKDRVVSLSVVKALIIRQRHDIAGVHEHSDDRRQAQQRWRKRRCAIRLDARRGVTERNDRPTSVRSLTLRRENRSGHSGLVVIETELDVYSTRAAIDVTSLNRRSMAGNVLAECNVPGPEPLKSPCNAMPVSAAG